MFSFLSKVNKFFRKIAKPVKHGNKIGKGIASVGTQRNDVTVAIGQGAGIILLSLFVLLLNRLTKPLPKHKKELIALYIPICLTVGGYVGNLSSNVAFTPLSSSFNSALGIVTGIGISATLFILAPIIHQKINQWRARKNKTPVKDKDLFSHKIVNRMGIGLEVGAMVGATIGAGFEFIHPGVGLMASAIGAVIVAPITAIAFMFVPKLIKKLRQYRHGEMHQLAERTKRDTKDTNITNFKSGMGIGAVLGSTIGAVIGTFAFPGLGLVIGGIIGGCIGGLLGGLAATFVPSLLKRMNHEVVAERKLKTFTKELSNTQTLMKSFMPIGAAVGALFGTFVFPGVGTLAGAALGGLFACVLSGYYAMNVSKVNHDHPANINKHAKKQEEFNETTSWSSLLISSRSTISFTASICGVVGGIVGTFLFPGVGTTLGAALGAGIGSLLAIGICVLLPKVLQCIQGSTTPHPESDEEMIELTEMNDKSSSRDQIVRPVRSYGQIHEQLTDDLRPAREVNVNQARGTDTPLDRMKELLPRKESERNHHRSIFALAQTDKENICNESHIQRLT